LERIGPAAGPVNDAAETAGGLSHPAGDETRAPQMLQMLRAVGDGEAGLAGQRLHRALALRDLLQQHEPRRCRQGPGDKRVLLEKGGSGTDWHGAAPTDR